MIKKIWKAVKFFIIKMLSNKILINREKEITNFHFSLEILSKLNQSKKMHNKMKQKINKMSNFKAIKI